MSKFLTRLISGIVLLALVISIIMLGGKLLTATLGIISIIGIYEFLRVKQLEKTIMAFIVYLMTFVYYILIMFTNLDKIMLFIAMVAILVIFYIFNYPVYTSDELINMVFAIVYIPMFFTYISLTRELVFGSWLVWLIFISAWGSDTLAYCAGMLFGKHKMTPVLSPKKTIEGAIGGVIGAGILAVIYASIMINVARVPTIYMGKIIIITLISSMLSICGDLFASGIKRNNDIKDYGRLIPGHGGILDRFDSVLFISPIVYYLCYYII